MKTILLIAFLFYANTATALSFEFDAFYFTDDRTNSSTESHAKSLFDIGAFINLDKRGQVLLGWNYSLQDISDTAASTTTYSLVEMDPQFGYYFDRAKTYGLFLTYNMTAKATYDNGTSIKLRGTSYKASFSYALAMDDDDIYFLGGKINYATASYTESVTGTTPSTVSYSRTTIYPSIHFIIHFE